MAGSVNKAIILGNLGKDPTVVNTRGGGKIVHLSVATSETWKDRNTGEKRERVEWHRVVIFNEGLAGVAEKYLRKGSRVYVEGQVETRKWQDQQGQDRYTTEIVMRPYKSELTLLGGADSPRGESSAKGSDRPSSAPRNAGNGMNRGGSDWGGSRRGDLDDLDDEIPF